MANMIFSARYTDNTNSTYLNWANTIWNWEESVGLVVLNDGKYTIYDGVTPSQNCTSVDHLQWSYELAEHLYGAAVIWNLVSHPSLIADILKCCIYVSEIIIIL